MRHTYFWTVFIWIFIVELYSVLPPKPVSQREMTNIASKNYVQGAIHVHSKFSDGGGTPDEIARAAEQAGLDFVVLTDHNNYEGRKKGFEKTYGQTDLFVEMEASTPVGHAVSFFSGSELKSADNQAIVQATYKQFLKTASYPGLFLSIAHPSNIKNPWARLDEFAEGLEVVNFDSSWQRQVSDSPLDFVLTLSLYLFNQYLSAVRFFETYSKDFIAWDEMTSRGPGHFAYLAHDTHSKVKLNNERALSWPGYLQTFKLASNILFLKGPKATDFESRKKQFYSSLREGRSAIFYQAVFPFPGNSWQIKCGTQEFYSGDVITEGKDCEAVVSTPATPFAKVIHLVKNGETTHEVLVDRKMTTPIKIPLSGKGTYRVEVLAKYHSALRLMLNRLVPYIFYSPIYLQ